MATTTAPQPQAKQEPKQVTKLPKLSPYAVPNLLCSNRECNRILTNPRTGIDKDTGEQVCWFTCENCHYDAALPLVHSNARVVKEGALAVKGPSEGLLGHARP
jgi:hypothetical protein